MFEKMLRVLVVIAAISSTYAASVPTRKPTAKPTASPTNPTSVPTTPAPTAAPTTANPSTLAPTAKPSASPSANPTATPTNPSANPTPAPTAAPTADPTASPSADPTATPTKPTANPTPAPTLDANTPTYAPTAKPTAEPTAAPTPTPTTPTASPTSQPTSAPSYIEESWGQSTYDKKRHRMGGLCENHCSFHGTCEMNKNCNCFKGLDGEAEWTGPDCSQRTCPKDFAWVGSVVGANNLHPWSECANKGLCDRKTGQCTCFAGYEGIACQRSVCPNECNFRGMCWPEKYLASKAGRTYSAPWDAMKEVGCLCDAGYRGPSCELQECPSGNDPLDGYGNEAGRDCSGRGLCDYGAGICGCFSGFFGTRCQYQTTIY